MDAAQAFLSDPANFKLLTTLLVTVLGGFAVWSFVSIYLAQHKVKSNKGDRVGNKQFSKGAYEDDEDDDEDDFDDHVTSNTMFDPTTDNAILYGKTDRYDWNQNESEVEIFVNLNTIPNAQDIKVKNINVTLKNQSLKMVVNGSTLLDGEFFAKVLADECSWQLDTNTAGEKVIWMTLYKAVPTVRNQHWRSVLKGDEEVKVGHLGPPVHGVDPADPDAVKKAIQQVSSLRFSCFEPLV